MRIILLGAPGSGKGTQGEKLHRKYGLQQIATGDLLRAAIAAGTPLGEKARGYVAAGALVSDDLILALVAEHLNRPEAGSGFILDGFPRSIPQADGLEVILREKGVALDRVIKLDVAKKTLLERMTSRRICPGCGSVYNLLASPLPQEEVCPKCGGRLVQRDDDTEATVRRRLNVYESSTAPLIDYYDSRHLLSIVNGEGTVEAVFERIVTALERHAGPAGR
jgi:adenylate kinase